jgi:hypothetical protein
MHTRLLLQCNYKLTVLNRISTILTRGYCILTTIVPVFMLASSLVVVDIYIAYQGNTGKLHSSTVELVYQQTSLD